ncbi:Hypothetical protein MexAM1_META2p0394 (plasmid) [Methylorubrum extorquens AM1]|uniref:Uncharacterized protein n=1 Tax=Methylorubrum extorquens (strain ATCC 14718 / DSM 1338 / JCM 2805 / NCIMB 9133 / AM1) TaxID=272630 RepID=C5B464_METEA|nr:Hypothetical protein MexAM1_META2p0394 [Methylorubrum extorquens AM1]
MATAMRKGIKRGRFGPLAVVEVMVRVRL